jgi:hypothetical protein
MWRQLSGSEKFRFVCCVIGLPATVLSTTFNAMGHHWIKAAIPAFLVFSFSYYLYKFATRGRESSNPTILIGIILAVIVLAVGSFFGYQQLVKHDSPPTTVNASDNSFTVTFPPDWRTANVPHAKAYVLLMNHAAGPRESMVVVATNAPNSTLQEIGKSAVDELVNQGKAVIDPDGGLQPTTVDGDAALRLSFTMPRSAKVVLPHSQSYFVLHRNVEYMIAFAGEPDEYASDHADFDAIVHSWKWSA